MKYEVIKVKTVEEALKQSQWHIGQVARCSGLLAMGNSDGTFTVIPSFEPMEGELGPGDDP